jgi:hypothetical protein
MNNLQKVLHILGQQGDLPYNVEYIEREPVISPDKLMLFHGTIVDNKQSIMDDGLIPGIGNWVADSYGTEFETEEDYEQAVKKLVFLADVYSLDKSVGAIIYNTGKKLGKSFHDVTEDDIRQNGLLAIIDFGYGKFEHRPENEKEDFYTEYPMTVEPGDWYSNEGIMPDRVLEGPQLMDFLYDHGELPKPWMNQTKEASDKDVYLKELDLGLPVDFTIWLVDGKKVREHCNIDFTLGGHGYVYEFIPEDEIWIDDDTAEDEILYVLMHEMHERSLMQEGTIYEDAHNQASAVELLCREKPENIEECLTEEAKENKEKKSSIYRNATLSFDVLKTIYEFTYKYGWILAEERNLGSLPDQAYLAKEQIKEILSRQLDIGIKELIVTYQKWIESHEMEENFLSFLQKLTSEKDLSSIIPKMMKIRVEGLDKASVAMAIIDAIASDLTVDDVLSPFADISLSLLFPNRGKDEIKNEYPNSASLLTYLYNDDISELTKIFPDTINDHTEEIVDKLKELYMTQNELYKTVVIPKRETLDRLVSANSLDEKIMIFQEALSEIHYSGIMADHLLGMPGQGKEILDSLSEDEFTQPWNKELAQWLGHPVEATMHLQQALQILAQQVEENNESWQISFKDIEKWKHVREEKFDELSSIIDIGQEYSNIEGTRFGVTSLDAYGKEPYRVTWYTPDGFIGHEFAKTKEEMAIILFETLGYDLVPAPGTLEEFSYKDTWQIFRNTGMFKIIQSAINSQKNRNFYKEHFLKALKILSQQEEYPEKQVDNYTKVPEPIGYVYHVSPYAKEILEQGFIVDPTKTTLGAFGEASSISTTNYQNAVAYKNGIRFVVGMANGELDYPEAFEEIKKLGATAEAAQNSLIHIMDNEFFSFFGNTYVTGDYQDTLDKYPRLSLSDALKNVIDEANSYISEYLPLAQSLAEEPLVPIQKVEKFRKTPEGKEWLLEKAINKLDFYDQPISEEQDLERKWNFTKSLAHYSNLPLVMGDFPEHLRSRKMDDVGIVEVAVAPVDYSKNSPRENPKGQYTYNVGEEEWRFYDVTDLWPVRIIE